MWPEQDDPRKMPRHLFAPDSDLDFDGAERADIEVQHYSVRPRYWYIDAWQACSQCKSQFPFTTAEQRFWYEERGFYVDSYPIRCKQCRRDQRRIRQVRQRYGELRADALRRDAPTKLKVMAILSEANR